MELIIGDAFTTIFGVTSGPEVTTFKILKTSWKSLDLKNRRLPEIPSYFRGEIKDILDFVSSRFNQEAHLPRGDYKELIQLVKVTIGGVIERKNGCLHNSTPWGRSLRKMDVQSNLCPQNGNVTAPASSATLD